MTGILVHGYVINENINKPLWQKLNAIKSIPAAHNGYLWWRYDMEMLSELLALCEGNPLVTD